MVALIGLVAALAALEAPRYVTAAVAPRFYALFHLFVFTMLLAVTTDDVGFMWVAIEGTTLASVFLVNFERTRASLEASYKYLLICSVGIAVAFLGTVLVYFADVQLFGDEEYALRWTTLLRLAPGLAPQVVQLAFVFLVVGYGTKAGLAPMHTWLPDAHSEAPAPVSALMSGVLLAVGVYAILRFKPVVDLAAGPAFAVADPPGPRAPLDGRGRAISMGADQLQADARLLERRARGHRRAWGSASAARGASPARCCTSPITRSPSPCSSCWPAGSAPPTARRTSRPCVVSCTRCRAREGRSWRRCWRSWACRPSGSSSARS